MNRPSAAARRNLHIASRPAGKTPRRGRSLRARLGADGRAVDRPETRARLAALAAQNTLYATAIEQIALGLCMFDAQDRLLVANRRYLEIWGLPEPLGRPGTSFAQIMAATRGTEVLLDGPGLPVDRSKPGQRRREWQIDDGRVVAVNVTRLPDGACVALHEDITDRRRAENRIAHLARHDALTGLANRAWLAELMQRQLARAQRGEALAVLYLDLDRFKAVNDTLGHAAGDALLQQVAGRLRDNVRAGDTLARLGGDEFAVLQVGTAQPDGAAVLGRRLIEALGQPFKLDGHQVRIGVSIGVATAPLHGDRPDTLLKHADVALYRAKAAGRGVLRLFEPDMDLCQAASGQGVLGLGLGPG